MGMGCRSRTTNMDFSSTHHKIWKLNSTEKLQKCINGPQNGNLLRMRSYCQKCWFDLFRSNFQLPCCIYWRLKPRVQVVHAFSLNCAKTYNYCFPPFSIIMKVLQKIQQNKAQAIVPVPFWITQNWFPVLLGMLVDHPLIMTALLKNLYFPPH